MLPCSRESICCADYIRNLDFIKSIQDKIFSIMLSIKKISAAGMTCRHFVRYRQIIAVLFKYGFEDVPGAFKIDKYIETCLKLVSKKRRAFLEKYSKPERIRMALEDL